MAHCVTLQLPQQDFSFLFFQGQGSCKGRGWMGRNKEMSGIQMRDVKTTKNLEKVKFKKKKKKKKEYPITSGWSQ